MEEIPEGWEIISRHGNYGGWLNTLFHLFILQWPPSLPSSITLKIRETSTRIVYSVTASDERGAMAKIRNRNFD